MVLTTHAQQIICERELRANAPAVLDAPILLRVRPDSLHLLTNYSPTLNPPLRVRIQRINTAQCDTLPTRTGTLFADSRSYPIHMAVSNRRGQVLIAQDLHRPQGVGAPDSIRILLRLLNRNGTIRWQHFLFPQAMQEGISGIVEAPENGFFLVGGEYNPIPVGLGRIHGIILRVDSTGRELWRRHYRGVAANATLENPTYSRAGTLVCTADYTISGVPSIVTLMEFNQRGDSLTTHPVLIIPQQSTRVTSSNALIPLRDGGFALVGVVDSANTGRMRPFLARLDRNLNLTWSYIYRAQPATPFLPPLGYQFAQPQELADGSLLVVVSNAQSGRGYPFWLFRFAATGTLQQAYPFVSQVLTANTNAGRYGFFGTAKGLQPLSDSSLVVVAGGSDLNSSRIYLAHLRVPGLPRVIDSHYVPAAQPLAARPGRASSGAGLELYPNPAREQVRVAYTLPTGTNAATLELHDALGRLLLRQALPPSRAESQLALDHLPAGLYSATLTADGIVRARTRLLIAH